MERLHMLHKRNYGRVVRSRCVWVTGLRRQLVGVYRAIRNSKHKRIGIRLPSFGQSSCKETCSAAGLALCWVAERLASELIGVRERYLESTSITAMFALPGNLS